MADIFWVGLFMYSLTIFLLPLLSFACLTFCWSCWRKLKNLIEMFGSLTAKRRLWPLYADQRQMSQGNDVFSADRKIGGTGVSKKQRAEDISCLWLTVWFIRPPSLLRVATYSRCSYTYLFFFFKKGMSLHEKLDFIKNPTFSNWQHKKGSINLGSFIHL